MSDAPIDERYEIAAELLAAQAEIESLRARLAEAEYELALSQHRHKTDVAKLHAESCAAQARLAEAEKDAERLDWIESNLIEGKWDGTIGRPKSWHMVGPYRHTLQKMTGNTLREAIDAAMEQSHE